MGYKIGKNSQGKLIIIKETPEEEKARLESVAGKIPVMVPILHNIAANVPAIRKYVEETPEMRNYEKFIPAAQVANFVGKTAKSMLFGNPTETDKKNEINRKIANDEPLTEEERKYSFEKNMMTVMDMATPTTTPSGASGLDDIARAQNIKNAGKDLNSMIQSVRKTANDTNIPRIFRGQSSGDVSKLTKNDIAGSLGNAPQVSSSINQAKRYGDVSEFIPKKDANIRIFENDFEARAIIQDEMGKKYGNYYRYNTDTNKIIDQWAKENNIDGIVSRNGEGAIFNENAFSIKPLNQANKVGGIDEVLKSKLKPISNIGGEINEGKNQIRYISPDGTPYSLRKVGGGVMGAHAMELDRMNLDANEAMEKGLLRALVTENKQTGVKSLLIENKIDLNPKQIETIKKYFPDYEIVIEKTKLGGGTNSVPIGDAIVIDKGINIKDILNRYNKEAERIK